MRMSVVDLFMAGYSSALRADWCARNGCITKNTPPPSQLIYTTLGYTPGPLGVHSVHPKERDHSQSAPVSVKSGFHMRKNYTNPLSLTSQFLFCGLPLRLDSYRGCAFQCYFCYARYRGGA